MQIPFLQKIPLNILRSPALYNQHIALHNFQIPAMRRSFCQTPKTLGRAPRSCLPGQGAPTLAVLDLRAVDLCALTAFLRREDAKVNFI